MTVKLMAASAPLQPLGDPIPDTAHAISVSLPTWRANVGYEEGEDWVVGKMRNGYPRFFIHLAIVAFQKDLLKAYGEPGEGVLLFPSTAIAQRCIQFIAKRLESDKGQEDVLQKPRLVELMLSSAACATPLFSGQPASVISAVFYDQRINTIARQFWQHTGDGVSSRRAEFFHKVFADGHLVSKEVVPHSSPAKVAACKGPKRYRRSDAVVPDDGDITTAIVVPETTESNHESADYAKFVEERFGRNLDVSLALKAKEAIRKRIAGTLTAGMDLHGNVQSTEADDNWSSRDGISEDDVFLYPCGMSAIYNTHRILLASRDQKKSIMFGFPYTDTLKVLEKFGPGALFYGNGSSFDLDDIERRCTAGEKFLALFCEFPGNPLLKSPDLQRIKLLADKYDFAVVVDETIGNFLNVNVLPAADVVVSSLTKVFSGDSNVMGGSVVLNPGSQHYQTIKQAVKNNYVDHLWPEDAVFLERNSRDLINRNRRVNANADAVATALCESGKIKEIHYPKYSDTRQHYDAFRTPDGGYSGLLSVTFNSQADAVAFYDALATAKGPSLGTNFTLSSPYSLLAHYTELDWVQQFGVDPNLVRISVGLEDTKELLQIFRKALHAVEEVDGLQQSE